MAWRDAAGRERTAKNTVSDEFWRQLVSGNKLVVQETPIKYLEGDISAGALSVIDADASIRQKLDDILWAIPFVVLGLSLSLIAAWQVFKRPSGDGEARSSAAGEQKEKGKSRFFDPYQAHWAILVGALGVLLLSWFTYDAWMDYSADKAMLADGVQTKAQIFDAHVNRGKKAVSLMKSASRGAMVRAKSES